MTTQQGIGAASPVLRDPGTSEAPRHVGRARRDVPHAPGLPPADAVAVALARLAPAPAQTEPASRLDEPALRLAREEGRQLGLAQGRDLVVKEHAQAGFDEGLRQGLAEGRSAGEAEAQRRLAALHDQAIERLHRIEQLQSSWAEQLHAAFRTRLEGAEDDMVALCHGVICRVLGEHLVTDAGAAQAVRTAVEAWLQSSDKQLHGEGVMIHVHPGDLDAMRHDEVLARWLVQQGLRGLAWEANESVRLGGCIVRSGEGDFDSRVEIQLANLGAYLARARHAVDTSSPIVSGPTGGVEAAAR